MPVCDLYMCVPYVHNLEVHGYDRLRAGGRSLGGGGGGLKKICHNFFFILHHMNEIRGVSPYWVKGI